ncbi:2'-5' RNA ligase family protein [Actinomadura rubrisoli]|uniref:2'-5' RNA ligase family protein n=1 Tax=Actinomadura rubrisoli TaxID=2530368 RepID=A0A4R5C632_9ACTN|nr:2'-5' RNA ligase family protein [Actinomadura rubrisoli]TDD93490.1 hypothetical protein E1298_09175 [Actinomadura rubrisoli]
MVASEGAAGPPSARLHILPAGQTEVCNLVRQYQDKLAGLDGLDLIPAEWLHMTTRIVGFDDEISAAEAEATVAGVVDRFRRLAPVEAELGKLWLHSEAVMLGIRPSRALDPVRAAIREATTAAVRAARSAETPHPQPPNPVCTRVAARSTAPCCHARTAS